MIDGISRNLDFVFCVDGTGSMSPCAEDIKTFIHRFITDFAESLSDLGSDINNIRAKAILFRDYRYDAKRTITESPFYELPLECNEFDSFLSCSSFYGGGPSGKRNGLEALYMAMQSDFTATANIDRQIIVLITNSDCYCLRECEKEVGYPANMVDETGLIETWICIGNSADKLREKCKRLVIFAPNGTKYENLKSNLNRSMFYPLAVPNDFNKIDLRDIINIAPYGG